MKSQGYLGAAIATSVGNFLRMLWVTFKRLGWKKWHEKGKGGEMGPFEADTVFF